MKFADTGGWFALFVPDDLNHVAAATWFAQQRQPLFTTDYVVDETLTLLRSRGQSTVALALGQQFFDDSLATIYYLTEADIRAAWQVFTRYADKEWSFTDCTSKVAMEKLGIAEAFAFDQHFRQFGTVAVVP
jgi:predicted nucleic acid-binding protein